MSDINSSLIGFLKKKSLFSNSPDKSLRNRERSKDKKAFMTGSKTPQNQERSLHQIHHTASSRNLHKEGSSKNFINHETESDIGVQSFVHENPIRYQNNSIVQKSDNRTIRRNFNFKNPEEVKQAKQAEMEVKKQNLWTGLVNFATTFESARIESVQCLDNMSMKIQTEVSNINYKIDVFQSKMTKLLNSEFANMKETILDVVNRVFEQSERNMKAYIKQQEEVLAGELIKTREKLIREYEKIEVMREDINKPAWRKVAGELLSSEMQQKVDDMLMRSRAIDIGHWQMRAIDQSKVDALEYQLREMVRMNFK